MAGKNAVITGANRGIGQAMVREFARAGYNIWACARKASPEFEQGLQEIAQQCGVNIKPIYFDLSNETQIKSGIKEILSEKKPIDLLINNAGILFGGNFNMTTTNQLREIFQINVISQILIMQLVSRSMIRSKQGCIVNMCSVIGMDTAPGMLAYGSSKVAMA